MKITVKKIEKENLLREESIFHTANGYLGVRGNFEEGYLEELPSVRGSYINGVYENIPMEYSERLYGFPTESQRMISLPDIQTTKILLDGENVSLFEGELIEYERDLDFEKGCQIRKVSWKSPKGKHLTFTITRLTSFIHKHLYFTKFEISSPNYFGRIQIKSSVGGFKKRQENKDDPRIASVVLKGFEIEKNKVLEDIPFASYSTISSKIKIAIFQKHLCNDTAAIFSYKTNDEGFSTKIDTRLRKDQRLIVEKYTTVADSLRNPKDYESCALKELKSVLLEGGQYVLNSQKLYMKDFWEGCRVEIDEDKALNEKLAFAQFQLLQCAGTDAFGFVAAKGLSGEGYEGHYFWDTEIYVFPFFLLTRIEIAESLLKFRYNMLEKAKQHARIMGHSKGALYPWRTINGGECSGYFPSGAAQYHINSDIAHTFMQYFEYTKNLDFMEKYGFEVLYETSLLFLDTGHYDREGRFCIDCVTGPDEYSCIVNNNYYTNLGAQQTLLGACKVFEALLDKGCKIPSFVEKANIIEFKKAAEAMYLPFDDKLGIYAQDDSFLNKKELPLNTIAKENFPLLLNYHPLFLYRHQICKQADTVLAHMLYGEEIDLEKQKKSFDYYEKRTTHDSTLSECVFCIQASRLGYADKAYRYFLDSSETDLEDKHGNTKDGLHIANLGGAYLALIMGFSGLSITHDGLLSFKFHPFGKVKGYHFRLTCDDCLLKADVNKNQVCLSLISGKSLSVKVNGELYCINSSQTIVKFQGGEMKGVIFDLDGVLCFTDKFHFAAWKTIADSLSIPFDEKVNNRLRGIGRMESLQIILSCGKMENLSDEKKVQLATSKNEIYRKLLEKLKPEDASEGALELLNFLKGKGIKTAIGSSSRNAKFILKQIGLIDYFDVIVDGFDIKNTKPDPEVFLTAAFKLNLKPNDCMVIEDAPSGIQAANEGKFTSVSIGDAVPSGLSTYHINKLMDISFLI